jgi:hypothetical protein
VAPNVLPETPSALQIREFLGLSPVCARPTAASEYKLVPFTFGRSKSKAKLRGLGFVTALYHMGLHFTESQPAQVRNEIARIMLRSFSTQMPANVSKKRAAASIDSDAPLTSKLDDYWAGLRGQSNHAEDCCTVECSYWSVYTVVRHRWAQPIQIVDDDVRAAIEQVHHSPPFPFESCVCRPLVILSLPILSGPVLVCQCRSPSISLHCGGNPAGRPGRVLGHQHPRVQIHNAPSSKHETPGTSGGA